MTFDWKAAVKVVAPGLATALGGPLAGNAVGFIANALLGPSDKPRTEEELAAAMQTATPEQLLALKKADQEFQVAMAKLDIDLEQIAASDRASARARETATKDPVPGVLAFAITGGFFGVLLFMLLHPIPESGRDALLVMLGALGTAWTAVVTYYYGSSAGSERKSELLAQAPAIGSK